MACVGLGAGKVLDSIDDPVLRRALISPKKLK